MILFAQIQKTTLFVISVRASMDSHALALVNWLIMRSKRKERARGQKAGPSYLTISDLNSYAGNMLNHSWCIGKT